MVLVKTDFVIPLILFCLYSLIGLFAIISSFIELRLHKASWNSIKIFFYSLLVLQCLCRCIIIGWGMIETVQGGEFYSNFPSLLFISYAGLIALQMIQFLPNDNQYLLVENSKKTNQKRVKLGTNILIIFNLFMYFGMFLLFGIAEKQVGNSTSFNHHKHNSTSSLDSHSDLSTDSTTTTTSSTSTSSNKLYFFGAEKDPIYIVLDCFYFFCLLMLLIFHSYVGWKTYKRNKDLFGIKLNVIHLILLVCIVIRSILVVIDPSSPNNSILHIDTKSWLIYIYTTLYYIVGEIIPGLLLIVVQFLLPYHKRKDFINIGGELSSYKDVWKSENIAIHELLGMGGSGAMVHRCTVKKGPLRGGTFAVKVMKDCTAEDIESLENEIQVYENLKSPYIVSYQGSSKLIGKSGQIYEIRLFMEYIPHTLDKYLLARSVCGDKLDSTSNGVGGGSNYLLKNYFLHMQEYSSQSSPYSSMNYNNNNGTTSTTQQQQQPTTYPYYFSYTQLVWYLYQVSIGLDNLHAAQIAHRDLKTNNIFVTLSDSQIKNCKIGDFDISKSYNSKIYNSSNSISSSLPNNPSFIVGSSGSGNDSMSTSLQLPSQSIHSAFQQDILAFGYIVLDFLTLSNYSCYSSKMSVVSSCALFQQQQSTPPLIDKPELPEYLKDQPQWEPIVNLYKSCTADDPKMRPSSIEVKYVLSDLYKSIIETNVSWSLKDLSK